MGNGNFILATTLARPSHGDGYDLKSVFSIAADCIVATHSATLDAVRRAYFAEVPEADRNAPRLYPVVDAELSIGFAWERRRPAGMTSGVLTRKKKRSQEDENVILAPDDEDGERYSDEYLARFCDEFELATILAIDADLSNFRGFWLEVEDE